MSSISADSCDEFLRVNSLALSLLLVAVSSVIVAVSYDDDVSEVGEDEVEALVDR